MTIGARSAATKDHQAGSPLEVLLIFLKLGLTCFGGPIAHLGYFREEFVVRRRWLDEQAYADLVALCQFLPGPASSQVGFSIGLLRAGSLGGLAAWSGFTLLPQSPSCSSLLARACSRAPLAAGFCMASSSSPWRSSLRPFGHGAHAMPRSGAGFHRRHGGRDPLLQRLLHGADCDIALGGAAGLWLCRVEPQAPDDKGGLSTPVSRRAGLSAIALFFLLLGGLPILEKLGHSQGVALFDAFYRSGALVFGGGHVVLPLLREAFVTPGWVSDDTFLAGYGAAQAVPGPLFTFAAYLGAVVSPSPHGLAGAALSLIAIFLPGLLILMGALPFWETFRKRVGAQAMMRGVNAAVVGLLGAALYNPVWVSAVASRADFALALVGFVLLTAWRAPPLLVVAVSALGGVALALGAS